MTDMAETIRLETFAAPRPPMQLRAVLASDRPRWLVSLEPREADGALVTEIVAPGEAAADPVRSISHVLWSPPDWDVVTGDDGALTFVAGLFGGASTDLMLLGSGPDVQVSLRNRTEPFTAPRIVREPWMNPPRITASTDERWVLFTRGADGYGAYEVLAPGDGGCLCAVGGGFAGFVLRDLPREPRADGIRAASLHRIDFDERLQPRGEQTLFGGEAVFGVAVERVSDDVAVLVAFERGAALLVADTVLRFAPDDVLSSPAVVHAGGALHVGFVAADGIRVGCRS